MYNAEATPGPDASTPVTHREATCYFSARLVALDFPGFAPNPLDLATRWILTVWFIF